METKSYVLPPRAHCAWRVRAASGGTNDWEMGTWLFSISRGAGRGSRVRDARPQKGWAGRFQARGRPMGGQGATLAGGARGALHCCRSASPTRPPSTAIVVDPATCWPSKADGGGCSCGRPDAKTAVHWAVLSHPVATRMGHVMSQQARVSTGMLGKVWHSRLTAWWGGAAGF